VTVAEVHEDCHEVVASTATMWLLLPQGDYAIIAQGIYFSSSRPPSQNPLDDSMYPAVMSKLGLLKRDVSL
jgi:hypothetical protein